MPRRKPGVYLFNWPSGLGGADTKAEHLLRLLKDDFDWTVVPNAADRMKGPEGGAVVEVAGRGRCGRSCRGGWREGALSVQHVVAGGGPGH